MSIIPNPDQLPELKDEPNGVEPPTRKTVTPLMRFLMQADTDRLLAFIQTLHLKVSITTIDAAACVYACRVFREGTLRFEGKGKGLKAAIADAAAQFFTHEARDYHVFVRKGDAAW